MAVLTPSTSLAVTNHSEPVADKTGYAEALEAWYNANARQLPWRETHNPYAIWLSEVMLQQTQVTTVLPYYQRFLEKYPTIQDLAKAPLDDVLKQWEGLGYYSRARNLHKAATMVATELNGHFPTDLEGMMALPGVGRSTAGAILTFSKLTVDRHPLLDGNVKRVLSRLYDVDQLPAKCEKELWSYSGELLAQSKDPWTFNQAMMELGATLCTQRHPQCLVCPVRGQCTAAARGTQHERPVKPIKKATPHYDIGAAVIWKSEGEVLIQQRPAEGLLGGLWEFPGGKLEAGETLEACVTREIDEELGITISVGEKLVAVKHAYSHFKITLHAYTCQYVGGTPSPTAADDWQWVAPEKLDDFAFPKANLTVIKAIHEQLSQCQ